MIFLKEVLIPCKARLLNVTSYCSWHHSNDVSGLWMVCSAVAKKTTLKSFVRNHPQILKSQIIVYTLYNTILRIARNFMETRESVKILTHPFYLKKSAILIFFFSFLWKSVQICMVEWMGQNFDVFPDFQEISCYA